MLATKTYQRTRALLYAEKWAFSRNPLFNNYDGLGGNCTNFVSQCLLAGSCVMNFTPVFGWYYRNDGDRSASWTGVRFFYDFIVGNKAEGPYGREVAPDALEVGDVIQLGNERQGFYHSLLVVGREGEDYLLAAQSDNAFNRPLSSYRYEFARYIHIDGVRVRLPDSADCFEALYEGRALFSVGEATETPPGKPPLENTPIQDTAEASMPVPQAPLEEERPSSPTEDGEG